MDGNKRFSKDEILELYLNRVYFGSGAYGVDAAARRYFHKPARDVNLAEAAILAGLLKAPSRLSPARNPKLAQERSQLVLAAMRREGFVSDRETATALTMQAKKAKRYWSGSEHYVADMVMKKAKLLVGEMRSDLIIDTTIDIDLQQKAGQLIRDTLDKNGEKNMSAKGHLCRSMALVQFAHLLVGVNMPKANLIAQSMPNANRVLRLNRLSIWQRLKQAAHRNLYAMMRL